MITGTEKPDKGSISVADNVELAFVEQSREALNDDMNVWQAVSDGLEITKVGTVTMNTRAYVAKFGFAGGDQQKKVGVLSGGERNRVHLACENAQIRQRNASFSSTNPPTTST